MGTKISVELHISNEPKIKLVVQSHTFVRNFHKSANDSHSVKYFKQTSILLQNQPPQIVFSSTYTKNGGSPKYKNRTAYF